MIAHAYQPCMTKITPSIMRSSATPHAGWSPIGDQASSFHATMPVPLRQATAGM